MRVKRKVSIQPNNIKHSPISITNHRSHPAKPKSNKIYIILKMARNSHSNGTFGNLFIARSVTARSINLAPGKLT